MKATATLTVRLEKADGTIVEATRSASIEEGDNPRFDVFTTGHVTNIVKGEVIEMIRAGRKDQVD